MTEVVSQSTDKMETNVPNVYAIGDCLGKVMLAHVASAQGEVAAENALGENAVYDWRSQPLLCIYGPRICRRWADRRKSQGNGHCISGRQIPSDGKRQISDYERRRRQH